MPAQNGRKALHAYVSDDAHDAWHSLAEHHGVSVSALLERLAPGLDLIVDDDLVAEARAVDTSRRRRRR